MTTPSLPDPSPTPAPTGGRKITGLLERITVRSGVSIATVSRALNNLPSVSEATRDRVLAAAVAEGWSPRATSGGRVRSARSPANAVREFALLIDHAAGELADSPTFARLYLELGRVAGANRARIQLRHLLGPMAPAARALRRSGVGGVLVAHYLDDGELAELAGRIPTVLVDSIPGRAVTGICPDDAGGVTLAFEHLMDLGHRRIVFFDIHDQIMKGGPPNPHHQARTDAFRRLIGAHGLEEAMCEVLPGRTAPLDEVCRDLLAGWMRRPRPPTAILCGADVYAFSFLHAAVALRVSLPRQLSLVGLDDTDGCLAVRPQLTSVRQDYEGMARIAFNALVSQLESAGLPAATVTTPCRIVVRDSTAPACR